ncbi:RNA polymerase sigma-70 factor [Arenibacter sp. GZD96]|uniref:RNA polymerase sigma factor n=1 Tax=Aurantibrevibacter litoralis TaxID=3106030 RepID=UPI002AFF804F|nr:RNA polymerase sigma-70 factor [Arenibacter sp. GZD-96]MEA1785737.1 RNA polymerase sigma-70 factor [Arenibacter sp. GZD-96]
MNLDYSDSSKLISELINGKEDAYAFLVDTYNHRLCVYAMGLTNDKDRAEDIVQNVFIRIWEMRKNLKASFSIKSYLYKSVYNEFIDQNRKRQSVTALEKKYIEALDQIVEIDEDRLEKRILLVRQEIERLPPKCRKIFFLSKEEGLSNMEIAERLDLSVKTVEAQMTKAFAKLRAKLVGTPRLEPLFFLHFGKYIPME